MTFRAFRSAGLTPLVLLLSAAVSVGAVPQATGQTQTISADAWTQLELTAFRTRVRMTLITGAELEGRIVEVQTAAVRINEVQLLKGGVLNRSGEPLEQGLTLFRSDIANVRIQSPHPSYLSNGPTDAAAVRRVVDALGVGRTVDLTIGQWPRKRARILAIQDDGFLIGKGPGTLVLYRNVTAIRPAGSRTAAGVKAAVVAGMVTLGVILLIGLSWGDE